MGYAWRAGEGVWGEGDAECVRGWSDAERWSSMQLERLDLQASKELREQVTGVGCRGKGHAGEVWRDANRGECLRVSCFWEKEVKQGLLPVVSVLS